MSFKVIDNNRYPLCPSQYNESLLDPFYTWEHRATLKSKGAASRVFIVFANTKETTAYIEELIDDNLYMIEEDSLFAELLDFVMENELLVILPPIPKASFERAIR